MRAFMGTAVLMWLAACSGDDPTDTDTDTDTDTTDTTTGDTGNTTPTTPFDAFEDANLTNPDVVRALSRASSPRVFGEQYLFVVTATGGDGVCPAEVMDKVAGTTTYTGNCTAKNGTVWVGEMVITEVDKTSFTIDYTNFGYTNEQDCTGVGTLTNRWLMDGDFDLETDFSEFSVNVAGTATDLDLGNCSRVEGDVLIEYSGTTLNNDKDKSPETWNGSGRYAHSVYGRVDASTTAEVTEGKCSSEANSGSSELKAGGDTVSIIYDGSTDCDDPPTVAWLLNGDPQGQIEGVACSSTSFGANAMLVLTALLLLRRRED